jgi:hypothetical protein
MFVRRGKLVELRQQASGGVLVVDERRLDVERNSCHAAADVAADGGGVDQLARGDDGSDAHLLGEMDVGHDRHRGDVVAGAEAIDRQGYLAIDRFGEPGVDRRQRGIIRWRGIIHASPPAA